MEFLIGAICGAAIATFCYWRAEKQYKSIWIDCRVFDEDQDNAVSHVEGDTEYLVWPN